MALSAALHSFSVLKWEDGCRSPLGPFATNCQYASAGGTELVRVATAISTDVIVGRLILFLNLLEQEKRLVSVREQFESYESFVIQEWWPDSRRVTDVDSGESRTLRPQFITIPESFDGRRMGPCRAVDPAGQARRQ